MTRRAGEHEHTISEEIRTHLSPLMTFALESNVRLQRLSSLSGTATAVRTVSKAALATDGAGSAGASQCAVGNKRDQMDGASSPAIASGNVQVMRERRGY